MLAMSILNTINLSLSFHLESLVGDLVPYVDSIGDSEPIDPSIENTTSVGNS
jgi:hypothetical protein